MVECLNLITKVLRPSFVTLPSARILSLFLSSGKSEAPRWFDMGRGRPKGASKTSPYRQPTTNKAAEVAISSTSTNAGAFLTSL